MSFLLDSCDTYKTSVNTTCWEVYQTVSVAMKNYEFRRQVRYIFFLRRNYMKLQVKKKRKKYYNTAVFQVGIYNYQKCTPSIFRQSQADPL